MQLVARETLPQLIEEPEPVQRQGLLQALLEGACRLPVDLLQLRVKTGEPLFGGLVGRLPVGPLELLSPFLLVGLRQMADYVFSLVPLAALDLGPLAKHLAYGLAKPSATVDRAKNALLEAQSSIE